MGKFFNKQRPQQERCKLKPEEQKAFEELTASLGSIAASNLQPEILSPVEIAHINYRLLQEERAESDKAEKSVRDRIKKMEDLLEPKGFAVFRGFFGDLPNPYEPSGSSAKEIIVLVKKDEKQKGTRVFVNTTWRSEQFATDTYRQPEMIEMVDLFIGDQDHSISFNPPVVIRVDQLKKDNPGSKAVCLRTTNPTPEKPYGTVSMRGEPCAPPPSRTFSRLFRKIVGEAGNDHRPMEEVFGTKRNLQKLDAIFDLVCSRTSDYLETVTTLDDKTDTLY